MTLKQKIQNEPYLKAYNCTDLSDVNYAIDECHKLVAEYGSKPSLCMILARLIKKKEKLEAKAPTFNLHPIFKQVLKPFGIK